MGRLRMITIVLIQLFWISGDVMRASGNEKESLIIEEGKVLELHDSNFESAISSIDYLFVDFYTPWCGHCKRLSPELDNAAIMLSELKEPIVIAKVNSDKYRRLGDKYDVDGYPTLKIFIHGAPMDYFGPRKAELLVRYLKKFVAPDVRILVSDSAIGDFFLEGGTFFPIFIGFGVDENKIQNLAVKYKKKAWFSIAKNFSEDIMSQYDFDKIPALLSFLPTYNERNIFYGPFEDQFIEDFIKQSFLPVVVPINQDTLNLLKDDERKIVLTFFEDEKDDNSKQVVKLLKAAAPANRDLVFGYVGVNNWPDFVDTFGISKNTKLPKMLVWNGDEEYELVIGSESIGDENQGTQIDEFLKGFREGNTMKKRIEGPSLMGFMKYLINVRTVYILVFIVAVLMILQFFSKEEPPMATQDETFEKED